MPMATMVKSMPPETILTAVAQLGLPVVLVCFFAWNANEREKSLLARIESLEDRMAGTLAAALDSATRVIGRNSEVLTRLEAKLDPPSPPPRRTREG